MKYIYCSVISITGISIISWLITKDIQLSCILAICFSVVSGSIVYFGDYLHNNLWSSGIIKIDTMTNSKFKRLMILYFKTRRYKVKRFEKGLIIERNKKKEVIAIRISKIDLGVSTIEELLSATRKYKIQNGVVITNREFTPKAIELAKNTGIVLWNRRELIDKLSEMHLESPKKQRVKITNYKKKFYH